jgi:hypothetical protein
MNFDARAEETYANKTVFMTADDGPNAATSIIIDIAERHQVASVRQKNLWAAWGCGRLPRA